MIFLEQNIKGLCAKHGVDYYQLLSDFGADAIAELPLLDIETIADEYGLELQALLFSPIYDLPHISSKLKAIKLLILDVDGVMTDGGMYYTENGDQFKKFNAKDGMGILHLKETKVKPAIISSGFSGEAIKKRAEILGISHCYVGRDPKIDILKNWCSELGIGLEHVAIIGDDINDLEIMRQVGFSACPADAVQEVKATVDLILRCKGGEGCIREFIDHYLLKTISNE